MLLIIYGDYALHFIKLSIERWDEIEDSKVGGVIVKIVSFFEEDLAGVHIARQFQQKLG